MWLELHHFHSLRKGHMADGSSFRTLGGLGALTREKFRNLNGFLDNLQLWTLHLGGPAQPGRQVPEVRVHQEQARTR